MSSDIVSHPAGIARVPQNRSHIIVFVNRTAGSGKGKERVDTLVNCLETVGFQFTTVTDPANLASAVTANQTSLRAIVAAGGDGTVAMVVNHAPPGTPIAILPLGTENLVAKYIATPRTVDGLVELIRQGITASLDAGEANGRIFLLMVGCGFDAEVVRRLHTTRRGHIRHSSYIKPILDTIRSYQYPVLCITIDRDPVRKPIANTLPNNLPTPKQCMIEARWAFVVNMPRYAMGLQFVPAASATDGLLDICTFRHGSFVNGLRYLGGVIRGHHLSWSDVTHHRASVIRIESSAPVPFQLDGDPGGWLPVEVRTLPARLRLIVDSQWASKNGRQ